MAGDDKTEKATPKKRQDQRKKGNIFTSKDITNVISLISGFYIVKLLFPQIYTAIRQYLLEMINSSATVTELSDDLLVDLLGDFILTFFRTCLPLLLISVLIAIVVTFAQTKMLFSMESLKPKFSRMNPLKGIKNIISAKSFVEVLKGLIKITIIFALLYNFFMGRVIDFPRTMSMSIEASVVYVLDMIMSLVFSVSMAFVAISVLDYFYQWWEYEKQMKMSKQEVKEEYKQMEGDPQVKGKIKEAQRKMAMSRMMQNVPDADVVIRNPTHFAVALKYNIDVDNAPIVVAKGQDELALRIVKVAEENNVFVMENKPLARAIYASTEIDCEIPMEYYSTIAEILVYVYSLNKKKL